MVPKGVDGVRLVRKETLSPHTEVELYIAR